MSELGPSGIGNQEREIDRLTAELKAWHDDVAVMAGYRAVQKMLQFRVGDQAEHAQAFRDAALRSRRLTNMSDDEIQDELDEIYGSRMISTYCPACNRLTRPECIVLDEDGYVLGCKDCIDGD
jgi:hypothetical protein